MKQLKVTDRLAKTINSLQRDMSIEKENIADALSSLSAIVNLGRDEEAIAPWTDDLLKTMFTVSRYNDLLNDIADTNDKQKERFRLSE